VNKENKVPFVPLSQFFSAVCRAIEPSANQAVLGDYSDAKDHHYQQVTFTGIVVITKNT
jgi:hypothetical protein